MFTVTFGSESVTVACSNCGGSLTGSELTAHQIQVWQSNHENI